jgi:hypothetical protein
LIATKGKLHLAIQVEATRSDFTSYTRLSQGEETRLVRSAAARRARPTLALVSRDYLWLVSVPDQIVIKEGKLRPLRYEYPEET